MKKRCNNYLYILYITIYIEYSMPGPRLRALHRDIYLDYWKASVRLHDVSYKLISIPLISEPTKQICADTFLETYMAYIFKIIEYIRDRISLDTVLTDIVALKQTITSVAQAEVILIDIQNIILSILDNIRDRVGLDIILRRITYLQGQIKIAPCPPVIYTEVGTLIIEIIDKIIQKESLDTILDNLIQMKLHMAPDIYLSDSMIDVQHIILSIIDNIRDKISIDIILRRFIYLHEKLTEVISLQNTG